MRNYSASVKLDSTFLVESSNLTDGFIRRVCSALYVSLEANRSDLTPSEERVISGFKEWCVNIREDASASRFVSTIVLHHPVFVYHNLNNGSSVAVVAIVQDYDVVSCPSVHNS